MNQPFIRILFVFIIPLLQACNGDVKVIKSEAWNNLMPGSELKTHILLTVSLPEAADYEITQFIVQWNDDKEKRLEKTEFSIEYLQNGESSETMIKASFLPGEEKIKILSVSLELKSGDKQHSFSVDKIEVEDVY